MNEYEQFLINFVFFLVNEYKQSLIINKFFKHFKMLTMLPLNIISLQGIILIVITIIAVIWAWNFFEGNTKPRS